MKREIKIGIGVAALSLALLLGLIGIGSASQGGNSDKPNTENTTENENENGTETVGTENLGTEVTESTEVGSGEENNATIDEYENFAIADVDSYVNVRQEPNTDSAVLGKIYDGAVAQILNTVGEGDDMWFQIISGSVEGYIKAEFFIHGDDATAVMD